MRLLLTTGFLVVNTILKTMIEVINNLIRRVFNLESRVERLEKLETPDVQFGTGAPGGTPRPGTIYVSDGGVLYGGGTGGWVSTGTVTNVTASLPLSSTEGTTPNISIAITTTNDGGAIVKQATTPGTAQTSANFRIDGTGIMGQAAISSGTALALDIDTTTGKAIDVDSGNTTAMTVDNNSASTTAIFTNNGTSGGTTLAATANTTGTAISGTSSSGFGVYGESISGAGLRGTNTSSGNAIEGVHTSGGNGGSFASSSGVGGIFTSTTGAQIMLVPGGSSFPSSPTAGMIFVFASGIAWEYVDSTRGWSQLNIPYTTYANRVTANLQTGQLHRFSDRPGELYRYTGTNWRSVQEYHIDFNYGNSAALLSATTNGVVSHTNPEPTYDIYVTRIMWKTRMQNVAGNFNSTNNFTLAITPYSDAIVAGTPFTTLSSWDTGRSKGTIYTNTASVNTQFNTSNGALFDANLTMVGTPVPIFYYFPRLYYNLVV